MDEELIAYCGMNCGVCSAYLKKRKEPCLGCKPRDMGCLHPGGRGLCEKVHKKEIEFCFECEDFPCTKLKALDKRYRTNHGMSMIENLGTVRDKGMAEFLKQQEDKYMQDNGCVFCVHTKKCYKDGVEVE